MLFRKSVLCCGTLMFCFVLTSAHADAPIGMDSTGFGVVPGTNLTTGMSPMDQATRPSPPGTMPNAVVPLAPSGPPPEAIYGGPTPTTGLMPPISGGVAPQTISNGMQAVPTPARAVLGQVPAGMMAPAPTLATPPAMPIQDSTP